MNRPRTLVSGGSGFVGRFIVERLLSAGHEVTVMGRTSPTEGFFSAPVTFMEGALDPDRDQSAAFEGIHNFVHAAFDHLPGKYRGGEGDDAQGFRRRNLDGTVALFEAARSRRVERVVFLSSRAVYGPSDPDVPISEQSATAPDTLYGEVKLAAEKHLDQMIDEGWAGGSLRITGVYGPAGPGREHKWSGLFRDYLAGRPIEPRIGTEVHGDDVADAVRLVLAIDDHWLLLDQHGTPTASSAFNVSDVVVDRHDLLKIVKDATNCAHPLPARADPSKLNRMAAARLRALGWKSGGLALLENTVREMARKI